MLPFACELSLDFYFSFFFFNDTATTEIYTLSLHDALPILAEGQTLRHCSRSNWSRSVTTRSEEHTSELQSQSNLVCRLLLEKKKKRKITPKRQQWTATTTRHG